MASGKISCRFGRLLGPLKVKPTTRLNRELDCPQQKQEGTDKILTFFGNMAKYWWLDEPNIEKYECVMVRGKGDPEVTVPIRRSKQGLFYSLFKKKGVYMLCLRGKKIPTPMIVNGVECTFINATEASEGYLKRKGFDKYPAQNIFQKAQEKNDLVQKIRSLDKEMKQMIRGHLADLNTAESFFLKSKLEAIAADVLRAKTVEETDRILCLSKPEEIDDGANSFPRDLHMDDDGWINHTEDDGNATDEETTEIYDANNPNLLASETSQDGSQDSMDCFGYRQRGLIFLIIYPALGGSL